MDKKIKEVRIAGNYQIVVVIISAIVGPFIFWVLNKPGKSVPDESSVIVQTLDSNYTKSSGTALAKDKNEYPADVIVTKNELGELEGKKKFFPLKGVIKNINGDYLEGAVVKFDDLSTLSNQDGTFGLGSMTEKEGRLTVHRQGYHEYSEYVSPTDTEIIIILKPKK